MFLPNKTIKNIKINYPQKKMSVKKTTQYGGDVVIFLLNKITRGFIVDGLGGPCK